MRLILDYELIVNMKEIRSIFFDRYAKLFYLNQIKLFKIIIRNINRCI